MSAMSERLEYRDGAVYWTSSNTNVVSGRRAGRQRPDGYRHIQIDGKKYLEHRVVWKLVHGEWPVGWIDHIDRDKSNNSIENLRDVTPSESAYNRSHCGKGRAA